jgi:hypothetical protein
LISRGDGWKSKESRALRVEEEGELVHAEELFGIMQTDLSEMMNGYVDLFTVIST